MRAPFRVNYNLYYEKGGCFMKQKHIDAAREARLWIGQILVPVAMVASAIISNPDARNAVANKYNNVKTTIHNKFKKG